MNALEAVEKEITLQNQALMKRTTLKATVKFTLFSEEAKARFGSQFDLEDNDKNKPTTFTHDINVNLPKKYWSEKEIKNDLEFRIGTRLRRIPGLQKYEKGSTPTDFYLNIGGVTLEEDIDFKYEIIRMTEYVYETDEPFNWDDIQRLK